MGKSICSIIVSVYNEEDVIELFYRTLKEVVDKLNYEVEILFINDGSRDNSKSLIDGFAAADKKVKAIHFSRNFGHEAAMIAGIDNACGDVLICMDADLQNPPQLIGQMLEKYETGNDIVAMVREGRADGGLYKRITSELFYKIINQLSDTKLKPNASDFFMVSRKVADVLRNNYRERTRFLRGFIQIVGFNTTTMAYYAPKRAAGESKYSFMKLAHFAFNSLVSFSKAPLKLGIYTGVLFGMLSIFLIVFSLIMWIVDRPVSGYTTIIIFLSAFAGILLLVIGIIGYYIGFILDEVKGRPIYIIEDIKTQNTTNER